MISVYSVLYTLALFSELSGAVPASEAAEDGALERGGFFLGDDSMGEPGVISPGYRQRLALDADAREEDGGPKIIFVSDARPKGRGLRGLSPTFGRSPPPPADRSSGVKIDRRNSDLDMLRCMIGRVYRPCWEV
ncbi:pro-MCH [Gasterosteus aculeatus]|uniref:Melanin-concentrating hormone n=2 Tax=Gasterosteus aculeatus TaxID=69293 RepID=A0AAQ4QDN2_GASAC|nr:pro-MCH [Gasterosteus aculeatus aculeatus]